jgi:hypothetical protein
MGHTSVRVILDTYGHLFDGMDEAAAEKLDAISRTKPSGRYRAGTEKSALIGLFWVEVRGFEPLASSVRGKRSAGLSYTPRMGGNARWRHRGAKAGHGPVGSAYGWSRAFSCSSARRRSCTTVVVRSARERSTSARETSVVLRSPAVMPSG